MPEAAFVLAVLFAGRGRTRSEEDQTAPSAFEADGGDGNTNEAAASPQPADSVNGTRGCAGSDNKSQTAAPACQSRGAARP